MSNRQPKVTLLFLLVVMVPLLVCARPTPASSQAKSVPIEMRMAHYQPEQRVIMVGIKWWGDQVKERTGGRIVIKHYFDGKLAQAKEIPQVVSRGGAELGTPSLTYHASEFPLMQLIIDHPWLSLDELFWVVPRIVEGVPVVAAEWKRNNLKPLSFGGLPPYGMISSKQIKNLDDLKNLRVRVWGKIVPERMTKLGMVPVTMASSEIYEAIAKGTVHCTLSPTDQHKSLGLWEVAKYHLKGDFYPAMYGAQPVMNLDVFNRLEPELRQILMNLQVDHLKKLKQLIDETDVADDKFLKDKGVNFAYISKAENKRLQQEAQEVWGKFAYGMKAQAEVTAINSALEQLRVEYLKTH